MMYCCRMMSQLADVNIQSSVGMFTNVGVLHYVVLCIRVTTVKKLGGGKT